MFWWQKTGPFSPTRLVLWPKLLETCQKKTPPSVDKLNFFLHQSNGFAERNMKIHRKAITVFMESKTLNEPLQLDADVMKCMETLIISKLPSPLLQGVVSCPAWFAQGVASGRCGTDDLCFGDKHNHSDLPMRAVVILSLDALIPRTVTEVIAVGSSWHIFIPFNYSGLHKYWHPDWQCTKKLTK